MGRTADLTWRSGLLCRTYGALYFYSTFTQGSRTWARLFRLLRRLGSVARRSASLHMCLRRKEFLVRQTVEGTFSLRSSKAEAPGLPNAGHRSQAPSDL